MMPYVSPETTAKLLTTAAASVGGMEALASRLDISERALLHYVEAKEPLPDTLLLRVIDLLEEHSSKH